MSGEKRIQISKGDTLSISIPAYFDPQKQVLLIAWLIMWSFSGLVIAYQLFVPQKDDITTYLLVWLVFWLYFEYKVIKAFRWRKWGKELLELNENQLIISRVNSKHVVNVKYDIEWIKDLKLTEVKPMSFLYNMSSSYWNPGQEKIEFSYKGREVYFGMELNDTESQEVVSSLKHHLKFGLK